MNNNHKAIFWLLLKKLLQFIVLIAAVILIAMVRVVLSEEYRIKEKYEVAWATRYSKTLLGTPECGNCISVEDTASEGFYYDTEEEATTKGHHSMVTDSLEGYKVYFKTFEVYPTLKPK